ncbi:hypothetical protein GGR54DRAFT_641278 [Hypoxylon sp. NC1633]|nr:hypothetical protein GGR54DRAFT_641278 [Hypoxylon sp. NC1633]
MACRMPECQHVRPNGSRTKVHHDKTTMAGTAFYYCSIHRVYHCVAARSHRRLPQPLCGECAWLFFEFPREAAKHPEADILANAGPDDENQPPLRRGGAGVVGMGLGMGEVNADRDKRPLPSIEEALENLNVRARNAGGPTQSSLRPDSQVFVPGADG